MGSDFFPWAEPESSRVARSQGCRDRSQRSSMATGAISRKIRLSHPRNIHSIRGLQKYGTRSAAKMFRHLTWKYTRTEEFHLRPSRCSKKSDAQLNRQPGEERG